MSKLNMPSVEVIRPNFTRLDVGSLVVWFSYKEPVAFKFNGRPRVVRENAWGPTTGKHLNAIDGGSKEARGDRVGENEFNARWAMMADLIVEQGINLLA